MYRDVVSRALSRLFITLVGRGSRWLWATCTHKLNLLQMNCFILRYSALYTFGSHHIRSINKKIPLYKVENASVLRKYCIHLLHTNNCQNKLSLCTDTILRCGEASTRTGLLWQIHYISQYTTNIFRLRDPNCQWKLHFRFLSNETTVINS